MYRWSGNHERRVTMADDSEDGARAISVGVGRAIPVTVDNGARIYLWAEELSVDEVTDHPEEEIAWRPPSLDEVLKGLTGVARAIGTQMQDTGASKASVEFACEFGLEAGSFVAVLGKVTGKSTFKVALEWSKPN